MTSQKRKMLRLLGTGFGIAVIIGGTIGVGILRMPGVVAGQLQNAWLILATWSLGGIYSLLASLSITELAVLAPRAGGFYNYARLAFGDFAGFAVGWADWFVKCAASAYIAVTLGEYMQPLVPWLSHNPRMVGIAGLLGFALLQWRGLRLDSWTQGLTSTLKAFSFLLLVAASFVLGHGFSSSQDPSSREWPSISASLALPLLVAFQSVIVTYDGYYGAIYFAEEDHNPSRDLPRSMIGGVLLVMAIYLLFNFSLLATLSISEIAESKLPAAAAAQRLLGPNGGWWITMLSVISIVPLLHALLMMATRILFALSRDGLFFAQASVVNRGGTPQAAMIVSVGTAVVLVASRTFERLVAIASFFVAAISLVTFAAFFALRIRFPSPRRTFRAWGYPYTTGLVLLGAGVFLGAAIFEDTRNSLVSLIVISMAYPVYRMVRR